MTRLTAILIQMVVAIVMLGASSNAAAEMVINEGQEENVIALVQPYYPVALDGWDIPSIRIGRDEIEVWVTAENGESGSVLLRYHGEAAQGEAVSFQFVLRPTSDGPMAAAAVELVIAAIIENDHEPIWSVFFAGDSSGLIAEHLPHAEHLDPPDIFEDAIGWLLLFFFILVFIAWRELYDAPRWVFLTLFAIAVAGLLIRLGLSHRMALGVWPWSRLTHVMAPLLTSDLLGTFGPYSYSYTDVATAVGLYFAALTPVAMYCHASRLLSSRTAGLLAAFIIAILPTHIRFSFSEVSFIPSLCISAATFAVLHSALKDKSVFLRSVSTILLVPMSFAVVQTRPLNVLFLPLFLFSAMWLVPPTVRWTRRSGVCVALLVGGGTAAVVSFIPMLMGHSDPESLSPLALLSSSWTALVSPQYNTLMMWRVTPPLLLVSAFVGTYALFRKGKVRIGIFLCLWLLVFLATHSIILPRTAEMSARYHLHLASPFVLLAAWGLRSIWGARPRWAKAAVAVLALSPLLHVSFIRSIEFADFDEWLWVAEVEADIPEECTVLEYAVIDGPRFQRGSELLSSEGPHFRLNVINIAPPPDSEVLLSAEARAALSDTKSCLYYYSGLECWTSRPEGAAQIPLCEEVLRFVDWELQQEQPVSPRVYNEPLRGESTSHLEAPPLRLYRAVRGDDSTSEAGQPPEVTQQDDEEGSTKPADSSAPPPAAVPESQPSPEVAPPTP